jgi:hypothetical protein
MKTIFLFAVLFCSCVSEKVVNYGPEWTDEQSKEFENCLDSLNGGTDTDCIDCQMKVFGAVVDSFYLL